MTLGPMRFILPNTPSFTSAELAMLNKAGSIIIEGILASVPENPVRSAFINGPWGVQRRLPLLPVKVSQSGHFRKVPEAEIVGPLAILPHHLLNRLQPKPRHCQIDARNHRECGNDPHPHRPEGLGPATGQQRSSNAEH